MCVLLGSCTTVQEECKRDGSYIKGKEVPEKHSVSNWSSRVWLRKICEEQTCSTVVPGKENGEGDYGLQRVCEY